MAPPTGARGVVAPRGSPGVPAPPEVGCPPWLPAPVCPGAPPWLIEAGALAGFTGADGALCCSLACCICWRRRCNSCCCCCPAGGPPMPCWPLLCCCAPLAGCDPPWLPCAAASAAAASSSTSPIGIASRVELTSARIFSTITSNKLLLDNSLLAATSPRPTCLASYYLNTGN